MIALSFGSSREKCHKQVSDPGQATSKSEGINPDCESEYSTSDKKRELDQALEVEHESHSRTIDE